MPCANCAAPRYSRGSIARRQANRRPSLDVRCTPNTCRLAAARKSSALGQSGLAHRELCYMIAGVPQMLNRLGRSNDPRFEFGPPEHHNANTLLVSFEASKSRRRRGYFTDQVHIGPAMTALGNASVRRAKLSPI
jgi:hypothetical protein